MTADLQTAVHGAIGLITLTRPRALNSLTIEMCEAADKTLAEWADDDGIAAIVIEGEGERAFCAGADIRWLYDTGRSDPSAATQFFRQEYRLDARLAHYKKPVIALMDGIVMGGGVGLSMHATHRIATDRTLWAMPECMIGLFPDVGTTRLLKGLPGGMGLYIGLTGVRLTGEDLCALALATHLVSGDSLSAIREEILSLSPGQDVSAQITEIVKPHHNTDVSTLMNASPDIDQYFQKISDLPTLMEMLESQGGAFGQKALEMMRPASPTSLALTLEGVSNAPDSFDDAISREFNVAARVMRGHDFFEGVRAQIIDKDKEPKWSPASIDDVSETEIAQYFKAPTDGPLDLKGVSAS